MSRSVLVVGGLVIAGAVIALVVMLRGGATAHSPATGTSGTTGTTGATGTTGGGTVAVHPSGAGGLSDNGTTGSTGTTGGTGATGTTGGTTGQGGNLVVPMNPNGGPPPLDPNAPHVTPRTTPRGQGSDGTSSDNYTVGDVGVRDHRGSAETPMDIPPNVHPPEGPRIDSKVTNVIAQQIRTLMFACSKDLSRDGRGAKPRIDGQIVVAVKAHQLTVLTAIIQPRDLGAAATTTLKTCMEPKMVGMTAAAPDQDDLASYSIDIAFTLL